MDRAGIGQPMLKPMLPISAMAQGNGGKLTRSCNYPCIRCVAAVVGRQRVKGVAVLSTRPSRMPPLWGKIAGTDGQIPFGSTPHRRNRMQL